MSATDTDRPPANSPTMHYAGSQRPQHTKNFKPKKLNLSVRIQISTTTQSLSLWLKKSIYWIIVPIPYMSTLWILLWKFPNTQFEIVCRFGGHSVTKKFKTIWQILLAKPKLWKNLYLHTFTYIYIHFQC